MNVLYSKEKRVNAKKLHRKAQESISTFTRSSSNQDSLASGDGDCSRCCRLCGGETMLKYFGDSYVWEGVEERYDQLLYDCFGVKVTSSDCMICDWCVRALRGTEKFRALVCAAFEQTASASDMAVDTDESSTLITIRTNSCQTTNMASEQLSRQEKQDQQKIIKQNDTQRKRAVKKMAGRQDERDNKRAIVSCELCKQKYPMMVTNGMSKSFTCSRCKKNGEMKNVVCKKCNIALPSYMMKEHMETHLKAEIRTSSRLTQNKKHLHSSRTKIVVVPKPKNKCTKDTKKNIKNCQQPALANIVFGDNEYVEDVNSEQQKQFYEFPGPHHCEEYHCSSEQESK